MKRRGMDASAPKMPSVDEAIAHLRGAAQPGWRHGPAALALIVEVERQRCELARLIGEGDGSRIGVRMLKEKIARLEAEVGRTRPLVEAAEAYAAALKKPEAGPADFVDQYGRRGATRCGCARRRGEDRRCPMIAHRPIRGRHPALAFDARLVRPLHAGTARHLGRVLLYLAPIAGIAIMLALWVAKHAGAISDSRLPDPSSTPWGASAVLVVALWGLVAIAASVMQGVR